MRLSPLPWLGLPLLPGRRPVLPGRPGLALLIALGSSTGALGCRLPPRRRLLALPRGPGLLGRPALTRTPRTPRLLAGLSAPVGLLPAARLRAASTGRLPPSAAACRPRGALRRLLAGVPASPLGRRPPLVRLSSGSGASRSGLALWLRACRLRGRASLT